MHILLVSTLKRRVASDVTASRSNIIYQLGKKLAEKGHKVFLLGTKDSNIPGVEIYPLIDKPFVEAPPAENQFYYETSHLVMLERKIEEEALNYDIIHNHTYPEFINLFASERISVPMVTTIHAQATSELDNVLGLFPKANLVSISHAHKRMFKKANIKWVVYNGVDTNAFSFEEKKEDYLLWLGRLGKAKDKNGKFMDAKGVRWAIELAEKAGVRIKLSGNVEDIRFFEQDIKPHLNDRIKWVGAVSAEQALSKEEVVSLMQKARAFLMTVNWEEPFGLVMAEAMSCGTPVIAYNRGSVPEILRDGLTGFIIDLDNEDRPGKGSWVIKKKGIDGLVEAIKRVGELDRKSCRKHVEENFSVDKMVGNYEKLYKELL